MKIDAKLQQKLFQKVTKAMHKYPDCQELDDIYELLWDAEVI